MRRRCHSSAYCYTLMDRVAQHFGRLAAPASCTSFANRTENDFLGTLIFGALLMNAGRRCAAALSPLPSPLSLSLSLSLSLYFISLSLSSLSLPYLFLFLSISLLCLCGVHQLYSCRIIGIRRDHPCLFLPRSSCVTSQPCWRGASSTLRSWVSDPLSK